ncbi:MAG TPA: histidine kinase, partial [Cyclobacteriaceae bacterium]|nr:histidine kinase [Cyclobacteriaceae bacterium]
MTIDRKFILRQLRDLFYFLVASAVQTYFTCTRCHDDPQLFALVVIFTFGIWVFLWKGHDLLAHYLSLKISWIEFPVRRFVVGAICTIGYTVLVIIVLMWVLERSLGVDLGRSYTYTIYIALIITVVITLFLHGRQFLFFWREEIVEKEKFQRESITAKYESLKNQVNPHFLFNNLNALTNLVYEDQEKAVRFVKQLADVYRYVLDTRNQEVVPLKDELTFLQSYICLQRIRFGDKLSIDVALPDQEVFITPLALQMLIENAIKHNIVSAEDPLSISIYQEN